MPESRAGSESGRLGNNAEHQLKENDQKTINPTETQGPCPGKVSVSATLLQAPIFMSMLPDGPASNPNNSHAGIPYIERRTMMYRSTASQNGNTREVGLQYQTCAPILFWLTEPNFGYVPSHPFGLEKQILVKAIHRPEPNHHTQGQGLTMWPRSEEPRQAENA